MWGSLTLKFSSPIILKFYLLSSFLCSSIAYLISIIVGATDDFVYFLLIPDDYYLLASSFFEYSIKKSYYS